MAASPDIRRRLLVLRAIAEVGKAWSYFGRIADTRGFADRAAGVLDELEKARFTGILPESSGRLADVGRLLAAFQKLNPPALEPEPAPTRPDPRPAPPSAVELIEAPGHVGEARLVARRIRQLMDDGVSPADIVVTARDMEATADVFAEVFDEYGVPVHGFPPSPLSRTPVVAFLLRAWHVPAGGFAFTDVAAVLRSTFFSPPGTDRDLPSKAEALLRKVGGPDGKDAFLRTVERWADEPMEPLEDEAPEAGSRRRTQALARKCRPFVQSYFALWDDIPAKAKPVAWVERLRGFARACGVEPATHPEDTNAFEILWSGLAIWVESLPAAKTVPASAFAAALAAVAFTARAPEPIPPAPAVRVLIAEDARHAACNCLFLTGLGEGSFPRLSPPDSLLTDTDRLELRKAGHAFPDPAARRPAEQALFDDLLARPTKFLVLSYPAVDAKGQDQMPSSFLADWREKHKPANVTKKRMLLQDYPPPIAYSDSERRVQFANALSKDESATTDKIPAAIAATLNRARQIAHARFHGKDFNRFDGRIDPQFLTANLDLLGRNHVFDPGHVFSPTALERYVACPFKFWLDHVLGVEPLDDPPDAVELTRRGSAIHRALKRVHEADPTPDDEAAVTAAVHAHFAKAIEEYQKRSGGTVAVALWELEALRLRRTAARYHGQWKSFRDKEAKAGPIPTPRLFEASFGLPSDKDKPSHLPLVITVGDIEVRICGTVDRIDTAELPEGLGVWIIDYKSGRGTYHTGAAVERLESLQLPLYALAAERVLFPDKKARPLGLAYWLVTDTGTKGVMPKKIDWPTFRDQLEVWVASLASNIRQGAFPLSPRSKDCTATCPHGPVCRITQHRNTGKRFDLSLLTPASADSE